MVATEFITGGIGVSYCIDLTGVALKAIVTYFNAQEDKITSKERHRDENANSREVGEDEIGSAEVTMESEGEKGILCICLFCNSCPTSSWVKL